MATEADIAWAAGLFEGEGCFSALSPGTRDQRRRRGIVATLTTSDLDVLERFQAIVGVGTIIALKTDKRWPTHKPLWKWHVQRRADVEHVGNLLRPWLGARRCERLDEVLAVKWEHEALTCSYCSQTFIPKRARKGPAYCSRRCSARAWAHVTNPRIEGGLDG